MATQQAAAGQPTGMQLPGRLPLTSVDCHMSTVMLYSMSIPEACTHGKRLHSSFSSVMVESLRPRGPMHCYTVRIPFRCSWML